MLPISNLYPLNELETNRLKKAISPHKISSEANVTISDNLTRDLIAINEFLQYVDAEPYVNPEKGENFKRVAFKKSKATNT